MILFNANTAMQPRLHKARAATSKTSMHAVYQSDVSHPSFVDLVIPVLWASSDLCEVCEASRPCIVTLLYNDGARCIAMVFLGQLPFPWQSISQV